MRVDDADGTSRWEPACPQLDSNDAFLAVGYYDKAGESQFIAVTKDRVAQEDPPQTFGLYIALHRSPFFVKRQRVATSL